MTKPHSLVRLKSSLVNTPHLIEPNSFNSILEYVNKRIEGNAEIVQKEMITEGDEYGDYSSRYFDDTKTAVMHIEGSLTYKPTGWEAYCGGTSYQLLKEQMEYFVSQGAKTVLMVGDSGGGEAMGMISSAAYMRKLADENGIKIIAYVDGLACSACYGLVCIADEIVASPDSTIGSVGVLIQLQNISKALEKAGVERTFITAGAQKVPFENDGSWREGFLERLQESVDDLYEDFTSHVANHRGISQETVKATEADVFSTKESLDISFIDKVMTPEEFTDYLADYAQSNLEGNDMGIKDVFKLNHNKGDVTEMAKLEEMQALLDAETKARVEADAALAKHVVDMQAMQDQLKAQAEALDQFKAMQEEAAKAKAEAELQSRKAALSAVMPVDKVDEKLASFASLDEATFKFMVGELQAAKDARAESFKPAGEEGVEQEPEKEQSYADKVREATLLALKNK